LIAAPSLQQASAIVIIVAILIHASLMLASTMVFLHKKYHHVGRNRLSASFLAAAASAMAGANDLY